MGIAAGWFICPRCHLFLRPVSRRKEKRSDASIYDYSLFLVALLNAACHLAALFSRHLFDGPFFLAELTKVASYAIILGGALIDQARLFDQVPPASSVRLQVWRIIAG